MTSRRLPSSRPVDLFGKRAIVGRQLAYGRHESIATLDRRSTILAGIPREPIIQPGGGKRDGIPGAAAKVTIAAISAERRRVLASAIDRKFARKKFLDRRLRHA